ncbi:MAG TPA: carboxypeptidase-like regulatory domain-containing protein [Candidatus Acidoferrum sp.]|jgi:hypothetical protein|nr:carboxypeptidase-like regulatory domain-containing protein [Candidatus Acidoferrum sp.]
MKYGLIVRAFSALLVLYCAPKVSGEAAYGTIIGTVTDPSGADVPDAKVAITNVEKGISETTTANSSGFYFLTNFGSLLQAVMFGFTGLRISENDWQKYPASLPAGWSKIEIDRVYVKGQAKRLVATDGSPAQFQTA